MYDDKCSVSIQDDGNVRILTVGDRQYRTQYSRRLIELIVERKGIERTPQYLIHKDERSKVLQPMLDELNRAGRQLRVLEVGCSAGHITECLNEQGCVAEIYSFDVDRAFVDITRLKTKELHLSKVKQVDQYSIRQTQALPYDSDFFDLVIVMAVVEHLPFENRHLYIDEYYRTLKGGGLIGFWDTPNRYYPFESHSIGLPFISLLPPQVAYAYARVFKKKMGTVSFPQFVRAGTGWRNSSYYELLPKALMVDIEDVSEEFGYGHGDRYLTKALARLLNIPPSFLSPSLSVVFRKLKNYE